LRTKGKIDFARKGLYQVSVRQQKFV